MLSIPETAFMAVSAEWWEKSGVIQGQQSLQDGKSIDSNSLAIRGCLPMPALQGPRALSEDQVHLGPAVQREAWS